MINSFREEYKYDKNLVLNFNLKKQTYQQSNTTALQTVYDLDDCIFRTFRSNFFVSNEPKIISFLT